MNLADYLTRIGLSAPPRADLAGLTAVHLAQALSIPYEAIDVHLGRPVSQDLPAIFDKLVTRRRGGWCYETNGLLGWALKECGFTLRRATGAVFRKFRGAAAEGNHVVHIVALPEGDFLADLGLGDCLREPLALREGEVMQDGLRFGVSRTADGWWRVVNDPAGNPETFDFQDGPADEPLIARRHDALQRDPDSVFVKTFEAILMRDGGSSMITGRVLTERDGTTMHDRLIADAAELDLILRTRFGLIVPDVAQAWPRILDRHAQVFGAPDAPV